MARPLAELTTLRLGGPPTTLVDATSEDELVAAVLERDRAGEPVLVLGGGSNVVVADKGIDGAVVHVATAGIARDGARLTVAAGEPWDALVDCCVADGLAGIECLAGIPGSVGATPIQNVGAYGQDVAETIAEVRALDRRAREVVTLSAAACEFAYRSSAFKREPDRWVVLSVAFALRPSPESGPIRYAELARTLGVSVGATAPTDEVRDAVLALRRAKGMVLDDADPDTSSAGSFFMNPILDADAFATLRDRCAEPPPGWPEPDGRIKTSAAWLIERAGFTRGQGDPDGIAISTKHVLALTNRGHGTTAELVALARAVADGVHGAFGVALTPEPRFVGVDWG